ncbi:MAG TPA: hypothetical protein VG675_14405 [Bryobacteraceae bacterium]|nr:hypothetical protein [Bryobacteraceae bacterium]
MRSKPRRRRLLCLGAVGILIVAGAHRVWGELDESHMVPLDDAAIAYTTAPLDNPATQLEKKLDSGALTLRYNAAHGYLESVLEALGIPASSQILVFSKTSFQAPKIGPRTPRAIYHTDNVAVGFVRGGDLLEVAAVDPRQGVVFYTIDQYPAEKPHMARRGECLQCHVGVSTLGVPGLVVRSVMVDRSGAQMLRAGSYITDHRSPLKNRWGGWYVTGTTGSQLHMGNQILENPNDPASFDRKKGTNVTSLESYLDTGAYLRPDSDIVSLMVLEHQTRMTNLITRLGFETRIALHDGKGQLNAASRQKLTGITENVVRYMLFADETPLTEAVKGTSSYAADFSKQGPHDHHGRSLRELDLSHRMFRYPCSFLIYSAQFDALPAPAKDMVYRRLWAVLSGHDQSPTFARLTASDRRAILEILLDTKHGLPDYWKLPAA